MQIVLTFMMVCCFLLTFTACSTKSDLVSGDLTHVPFDTSSDSVMSISQTDEIETKSIESIDNIIIVDDIVWAMQPDIDLNRFDVDYPENSLVILNRLKMQFQKYEDHPEQRFAVAVGFHIYDIGTFHLTSEMRETEEHLWALDNHLTWNGLEAETALQYYERHSCWRKGKEETYIYQSDDLWSQYLNVIFQDVYAEYRSRGIEVIPLQESEQFQSTGIPGTVLLIGTQEQILSIQNDKPYVWYVGLAEYNKDYLEDGYHEIIKIKDNDFVCFDPFYDMRSNHIYTS